MKTTISIKGVQIDQPTLAIAILTIVYLVGIAGILGDIHPQFIYLTPLNLLFSMALVLWHHEGWKPAHVIFCIICFTVGLVSEIIGVQTGLIFGEYTYGPVLGLKIWDTPVLIGLNWLMLVYCSSVLVNGVLPQLHYFLKAILAAAAMVGLDFFIEPVAVAYDFWSWENEHIPVQNYMAWFLIALVLCMLFQKMVGRQINKVAVALFILQLVFFGSLVVWGAGVL